MIGLLVLDLAARALTPSLSTPSPDRIISGSPKFRTWEIETQPGGLFAGIWESTPGKWRVEYDEWEYCRVLEGISIVCGHDLDQRRLCAGDSLIIRPGFKGTWEVLETTRKEFVIRI